MTFETLIAEAEAADVTGWNFDWLTGRATEERPPWRYSRLLAARLAEATSALDIDTGGGEVVAEAPVFPPRLTVTEGWPPNIARARHLLTPRGADVVPVSPGDPLPFPDASFDLVTSRHPVRPNWPEIARVLTGSGAYLAQHVGPQSAIELSEWFLGALPRDGDRRSPSAETAAARAADLEIVSLRTARLRMRFHDIGAVVYILRKCVWWVPDFTVDRYLDPLRRLHTHIQTEGAFTAHSTRTLIEARHTQAA